MRQTPLPYWLRRRGASERLLMISWLRWSTAPNCAPTC